VPRRKEPRQTHWQFVIVVEGKEQVIRDWPVTIAAEANAINEAKRQRKALNAGVKVYKLFADESRELVNIYPSLARSNP
jgi:hypothetical protein